MRIVVPPQHTHPGCVLPAVCACPQVVRSLTADGTTVCATIHSPTASTFALFDRVLLLVSHRDGWAGRWAARCARMHACMHARATRQSDTDVIRMVGTISYPTRCDDGGGRVGRRPVARTRLRCQVPGSRLGVPGTLLSPRPHLPAQVRGQVVYFGRQGAEALQFAIDCWPASATATLPAALLSPPMEGTGGSTALVEAAFNDAEWLVEVVTEADHRKEGHTMAEAYARSALKQVRGAWAGRGVHGPSLRHAHLSACRVLIGSAWASDCLHGR